MHPAPPVDPKATPAPDAKALAEQRFNLYADAIKFLLKNVTLTGHIPATDTAQFHINAITAFESDDSGGMAPNSAAEIAGRIPGVTVVPPKPGLSLATPTVPAGGPTAGPLMDPHNAAVKKV